MQHFIGRWAVDHGMLIEAAPGSGRFYVFDGSEANTGQNHEGPMFKFAAQAWREKNFQPHPHAGDPVFVKISWRAVEKRGWAAHRPKIAPEIRVSPLKSAYLTGDLERPLDDIILTTEQPAHNACMRLGESLWLALVIDEPVEKYEPLDANDINRLLSPEAIWNPAVGEA
jgi:hypothetical protein